MYRKTSLLTAVLLLASIAVRAQSTGTTTTFSQQPNTLPVTAHEKFATFLADDDFKSVLLLENFRPDVAITFTPTLILSTGEVTLQPVSVPAHNTATLDINAILKAHGYMDTRGTVAVRFDFSSYGSGSSVVEMRDEKHQLFLNSYAQSPEEYWSGTVYDAVVWAPHEGTEGFISVTNASAETHIVHTTFLVNGRSDQQHDIQMSPRETRILSISDLVARSRQSGGGIHIQYDQAAGEQYPGAILVEGQLFNKRTGFAKHIHFMDKALPPTGTLRSHFLMLGAQPPEDNFPANVSFHSVAAVRNIDNIPVTVIPTVKFVQHESIQTVTLPSRVLGPDESWLIDFSAEKKAGHLPPDFNQGSLELIPDTGRSSIVGELFNFNGSGGYVVGPSLSSYPNRSTASIWRTDGSFQTTIIAENTAVEDDRVTLRLYSDRSIYSKTFSILAGKLLKINVRDLQLNGVPDDNGNLLLGTSGVLSIVGSHNTNSKLLYDKIIHSANQSDYVGLPPSQCDFVTGIIMFLDLTSGSSTVPIMKEYDWAQSGIVDTSANGSSSSDSSLAQIASSGSGDVVTFTPANDGQVHTITISPLSPQETTTNCDACSAGSVFVRPISMSVRTVSFIGDTCAVNPNNGMPTIVGSWGVFGTSCGASQAGPPLPSGGTCVQNGPANCYEVDTPTCRTQFCPGQKRTMDSQCLGFLDQFPFVTTKVPAGCS